MGLLRARANVLRVWGSGPICSTFATHTEVDYRFAGVALLWQFAFFVIATDPARYRPMIIPSILEEALDVGAKVVLYVQNRITDMQPSAAAPDVILCLLFVTVFVKTGEKFFLCFGEVNLKGGLQ